MRTLSRVLVATDFSPAGRAAVARAAQIASQHGAALHLVHATPDWNLFSARAPMQQTHYQQLCENAERLLQQEIGWAARQFAIPVNGETQHGKASEVISRLIGTYQPNLLVIGARGEHAAQLTPTALGGTTLKLLSHVTVPTLLVRSVATDPYDRAVAAVGPSDEQAMRIVHWASFLVREQCHVVRAYEVPYLERLHLSGAGAEAVAKCSVDMAARYAAHPPWSHEKQSRVQMHLHLVRGIPETMVLAEVARLAPQVVALGLHEETPLRSPHPLMGCVGVRIAYHCPTDVLFVP